MATEKSEQEFFSRLFDAFVEKPEAAVFALLGLAFMGLLIYLQKNLRGRLRQSCFAALVLFTLAGLSIILARLFVPCTIDQCIRPVVMELRLKAEHQVEKTKADSDNVFVGRSKGRSNLDLVFLTGGKQNTALIQLPSCAPEGRDRNQLCAPGDLREYRIPLLHVKEGYTIEYAAENDSLTLHNGDSKSGCNLYPTLFPSGGGTKTCTAVSAGDGGFFFGFIVKSATAEHVQGIATYVQIRDGLVSADAAMRLDARKALIAHPNSVAIAGDLLKLKPNGPANVRTISNTLLALSSFSEEKWSAFDEQAFANMLEFLLAEDSNVPQYARVALRRFPKERYIEAIDTMIGDAGRRLTEDQKANLEIARADIGYNLGVGVLRRVEKTPGETALWQQSLQYFNRTIDRQIVDDRVKIHPDVLKNWFGRALVFGDAFAKGFPLEGGLGRVISVFDAFSIKASCADCNYPYGEQLKAALCIQNVKETPRGSDVSKAVGSCLSLFVQ